MATNLSALRTLTFASKKNWQTDSKGLLNKINRKGLKFLVQCDSNPVWEAEA